LRPIVAPPEYHSVMTKVTGQSIALE